MQHGPGVGPRVGLTAKRLSYDGWNALVALDDTHVGVPGVTSSRWLYDGSHRLQSVSRGLASVTYGYEVGTRRRSFLNSPSTLSWTYDGLGRLETVNAPWGSTAVSWEPGGQRLLTLGGESFTHDGRGWLESITTASGVRRYGYDGRGNRKTESDSATGLTRQFSYDDADRLIAAQEWDGHLEAWQLASDGARQASKKWPVGTPWPTTTPFPFTMGGESEHLTYSYEALGALEVVRDGTTGSVVLQYGVDANGQVTSRTTLGRTTTFGWDVDGRLVSASQPSTPTQDGFTTKYSYDGLGLRRSAEVVVTPPPPIGPLPASVQTWMWGGESGEEEVAEGANLTSHVAGFRLGDGPTSFTHDALGSVVNQTGSFGTFDVSFSAWGKRTAAAGAPSNAGHTGHRVDLETGFTYAQQRWYDSEFGIFLSRDSIGASSYLGSPNGMGPWSYANLSPARFTDPDGRRAQKDWEAAEISGWQNALTQIRSEYDALPAWNQTIAWRIRAEMTTLERNIIQRSKAIDAAWAGEPVVAGGGSAFDLTGRAPPTRTIEGFGSTYQWHLPEFPEWHVPNSFVENDPRNGPFTQALSVVGPFAGAVSTPRVIAEPTGPILDAQFINGQWQMPATGRLPSNAGSGLSVAGAEGGLAVPAAPALTPGTFTGEVGIQPYWEGPNALRRAALDAHSVLASPKSRIPLTQTTVALALVRLANGKRTVFAAGSGAVLTPKQRDLLLARGVPGPNILSGAEVEFRTHWTKADGDEWNLIWAKPPSDHPLSPRNHGEQVITRSLPAGATVEAWGISWAGNQKPFPCIGCAPIVLEAPLQFYPVVLVPGK